jgi:hypothetical protein
MRNVRLVKYRVKARSVVKLALQDSYCGLLMNILKTGVERFL